MYYEFYIDVFFVVNFLLDFLVLRLTSRVLGKTANFRETFAGALFGTAGMCVFILLCGEIKWYRILIFYSVSVFFMLRLGCGLKSRKQLLAGICVFHGSAFCMGGFLMALPYRCRGRLLFFFAAAAASWGIIDAGIRLCKYLKGKRTVWCDVFVTLNKKEIKVKGLYDTGNCLYDLETGKPVCVMEYSSFCRLLEKEQQEALEKFCSMAELGTEIEKMEFLRRLKPRFLLYTSVGCQKGLLPVVTTDRLTVLAGEEKRQIEKAPLGLSGTALSPYGNFQIIISPTILDS